MFGSSVLEIALGLTLIYTMLSLVCTAANELVASLLGWRAKNLVDGITNLLNDTGPMQSSERIGPRSLFDRVLGWRPRSDDRLKTVVASADSPAQQLYSHPLVQSLYRKGQIPSYIPSRTFALALMDIVFPSDQPRPSTIQNIQNAIDKSSVNDGLKRVLRVLTNDAANTIETGQQLRAAGLVDVTKLDTAMNQVHENVEIWFNNSMERVSGWYKRKSQALTFGLAAVLTVALNVDTINIVRRLSYDSALRQSLVAQAEKLAEQPPAYLVLPRTASPAGEAATPQPAPQPVTNPEAATSEAASRLQTQYRMLASTGIPLGWSRDTAPIGQTDMFWWLTKVFGLLLTVGAASLGAPFWFDILNKIITIRSAGKAPEETPKRPKEMPRPLEPGQTAPPSSAAVPAAGATAPRGENPAPPRFNP
jgi:hypothetical protein